jgi:hypothetical protein
VEYSSINKEELEKARHPLLRTSCDSCGLDAMDSYTNIKMININIMRGMFIK